MTGTIMLDTACIDKAGTLVAPDASISIKGEVNPYVSRGGLKLKGALLHFKLPVSQAVVLDVGASTGGFTDCLLQEGARKVYALDVGYGQLAWKVREDPRVVVIERTNIRHFDGADLDEKPSLAVVDVSFISLKTVLPAVIPLLAQEAQILALIKPQFEALREEIGAHGVVDDAAVHDRVIVEIAQCCEAQKLYVAGTCASPLTGPAGNREFFILARKKV
jgi:23S rRNA (cytidine1920-2'-O)/16S rRNA (cytidine1409-2'-O)-methyltransferase